MRGLPPNPLLTQFRKLQPSPLEIGDHLISDFFADILTFFHDGWENWKITRGSTAGPEGRSGGRSEARSAERRPERSPEGPAVPPRGVSIYFIISFHEYHHRVVSIYFIFSFHEYHQHPPGFNFFFRVSWIPPMVFKFYGQKYSWIPPKISKK